MIKIHCVKTCFAEDMSFSGAYAWGCEFQFIFLLIILEMLEKYLKLSNNCILWCWKFFKGWKLIKKVLFFNVMF